MIPTLGGGYFAESVALAMDPSQNWDCDGTCRFYEVCKRSPSLYSMII